MTTEKVNIDERCYQFVMLCQTFVATFQSNSARES